MHRRDHALFVCFAPVHAPRYAVSVVVEHGGGGSKVAAPIARDILIECQRRDPSRRRCSVSKISLPPATILVGWSLGASLATELVADALRQAVESRRPDGKQLLHHSDRGCQYTADRYQAVLMAHRLTKRRKAVLAGNGPCNRQRLRTRRQAHESGAWVREAATAYAAKHVTD